MNKKRWTPQEEKALLRQVKAFPQNLSKCFIAVAEQTGRSKDAVAFHWYTKVSRDPKNIAFFTASPHTVSKNKKITNEPIKSEVSVWYKLLALIRKIV